jgi:hypothetical protein
MLGLAAPAPASALLAGCVYTPYHVATMAAAALVTWFGVQTWDFTRRLTWPRTAVVLVLSAAAVLMLVATSFHPFIYFIF